MAADHHATTLVRGRYRPLQLLRETLFGAVYLCEDTWRGEAERTGGGGRTYDHESDDSEQRPVGLGRQRQRQLLLHVQSLARRHKRQPRRLVVLKHMDLAARKRAFNRMDSVEDDATVVDDSVDVADVMCADGCLDESGGGHRQQEAQRIDAKAADAATADQTEQREQLQHMQLQPQMLDDPQQERAVADLLRRVGGHPNVVRYIDAFVEDDDDNGDNVDNTETTVDENSSKDKTGDDAADNTSSREGAGTGSNSSESMFFVLEYCADSDLHEYLVSRHGDSGRLSPFNAMSVLAQVASGVAFLHALGLAHRDISLENVLLHRGVCKLTDFGLSASARQLGTKRVGKAYYMAPEVVAITPRSSASSEAPKTPTFGVSYDARAADMWSLGITFFILLTGAPLVPLATRTDRSFAAFERHGVRAVLKAWGREAELSPRIIQLLEGMLAVDPLRRLTIDQVLRHSAFDDWKATCASSRDLSCVPSQCRRISDRGHDQAQDYDHERECECACCA